MLIMAKKVKNNHKKNSDGFLVRRLVWDGEMGFTRRWSYDRGGLEKKDLLCVRGKIVSKTLHETGKASSWIAACLEARKALNIKGFKLIKKGTDLYKKAKELHNLKKLSDPVLIRTSGWKDCPMLM